MLDSLLTKCTSLAHFSSIINIIDQVANVLKTSFNGTLEQETISLITTLIQDACSSTVVPPVVTPEVLVEQTPSL